MLQGDKVLLRPFATNVLTNCRGRCTQAEDDDSGSPNGQETRSIPPAGTSCAPLFNIVVEFAIDESFFTELEKRGITPAQMGMDLSLPKAPNVFNAVEKLGLHLEKSKASREFIVIEHIERPSPN
jgi:hypothetical protein